MKRSFCDISLNNILDDSTQRKRRRTQYYVDPNYLDIMTKDVPYGEMFHALHDYVREDSLHEVTVDPDYNPDADDNGGDWVLYEEDHSPFWFYEDEFGFVDL